MGSGIGEAMSCSSRRSCPEVQQGRAYGLHPSDEGSALHHPRDDTGQHTATKHAFDAPPHAFSPLSVGAVTHGESFLRKLCVRAWGLVCMRDTELPACHKALRRLASCSGQLASSRACVCTMFTCACRHPCVLSSNVNSIYAFQNLSNADSSNCTSFSQDLA